LWVNFDEKTTQKPGGLGASKNGKDWARSLRGDEKDKIKKVGVDARGGEDKNENALAGCALL